MCRARGTHNLMKLTLPLHLQLQASQAFSPALFYKVGRAGLEAGGVWGGEREKK